MTSYPVCFLIVAEDLQNKNTNILILCPTKYENIYEMFTLSKKYTHFAIHRNAKKHSPKFSKC